RSRRRDRLLLRRPGVADPDETRPEGRGHPAADRSGRRGGQTLVRHRRDRGRSPPRRGSQVGREPRRGRACDTLSRRSRRGRTGAEGGTGMTDSADSEPTILIAGAGATGGAFGSYLVEAGRRVTFLLRPARAEAVRTEGLRFVAPDADRTNAVDVVTADELATSPRTFDIVIIAVKAGGLDSALADIRPAVGPDTRIIPFLNGMAQIDRLQADYRSQTLGGFVKIVGTVDDGTVHQLTGLAVMTIGGLGDDEVPDAVVAALDVPGCRLQVV